MMTSRYSRRRLEVSDRVAESRKQEGAVLRVVPSSTEPALLDSEPRDTSDMREVRHWISVYSGLLEPEGSFRTPSLMPEVLERRFVIWHDRLDFWRGRAREITSPSTR